jgi:8-oxo-dGTP pyrophosphatase MutT (NUDIX family)
LLRLYCTLSLPAQQPKPGSNCLIWYRLPTIGEKRRNRGRDTARACVPLGCRMKFSHENPLAILRAVLPQDPPDVIGCDDFAAYPEMRHPGHVAPIPASVLIPIIARPEPTILFTQRTAHLARHSGQISFPGGRREAGDLSPVETALRETMEETGIAPAFITIAGFLPRYLTGTGFDIQPVVGVVTPGFGLAPDPAEVADIFEVALSFFLDPANAKSGSRDMAGKPRQFHIFEPDGHYIWGITAALLFDFAARLRGAHAIQTP